tara:strand:+ start:106 stop:918 length:813 start_codon:yes stop_codon:yes gene_type:complete
VEKIIVYGIFVFFILGIISVIITWIVENWFLVLSIATAIVIFLALKFKTISRQKSISSENNSNSRPPNYPTIYNSNLDDVQVVEPTYTHWDLGLLNDLEWKRFEEVVSEYYTLLGYRSEVTRMGADGGVDVVLYQQGAETPAIIVQCKSWYQKVGVKAIRELYGIMAADEIGYGVFATTSSYTEEAIEWAGGKRLQLLCGQDLVSAFNQLPEDQRIYLVQFGTFGDYSTPTCPSCDKKMVKRTASKGKSAGSIFWGCANYPRCKQTFKFL